MKTLADPMLAAVETFMRFRRASDQDHCARHHHAFHSDWHDRLRRCGCGCVHPDDLNAALA